MSFLTCPECGARLADGAERCDLCGMPVDPSASAADSPANPTEIPGPREGDGPRASDETAAGGVFCNECGWKNPLGAKFCSQCGTKLQNLPQREPAPRTSSANQTGSSPALDPGEESAARSGSDLSRYVGALIGLAVLIVVALYMITVVSKQNVSPNAEAADAVEAPADVRSAAVIEESEAIPIANRYAATVDSFRTAIEQADSSAKVEIHRDLVDFLVEIRRIDRAAIEQQRLARDIDTVPSWRRAGDLLYDWMETVNTERKTDVALLAIDAYERVLERDPDNLDVRADLGWVYQYDPQNPMEAIRQTTAVLEADPDHLAANYNRGVFLLRINRVSDALDQFRRVKDLSAAGSPYYQQADAWIQTVNAQSERERGS